MARIIADAPEEICHVLMKVKMEISKSDSVKSLGATNINVDMLSKTLGYIKDIQVNDESITRLLKEGKKEMIVRALINLMPLPCVTCNQDSEFQIEDRPQVRCRRCNRGACVECFPEPKNGWAHLCKCCDEIIQKQLCIPKGMLTAKQKKVVEVQPGSQVFSQNIYEVLTGEDEEDDELEEAAKVRENKRKNEEGDKKSEEEEKKEKEKKEKERKEKERKKEEREKEICKAFKFGGKCPHGMNGLRRHEKWDQCNKSHPKVCNKLLTHGARGRQGCDGQNCEKYHPRMCFSSMNTKVCKREKCTYWHCKGTTFSPESGARYEAPSRSSLHEYPLMPARPGRSPARREPQEGYRPRGREEPRRWEREEMRSRGGGEEPRRGAGEEKGG